MKYKKIDWNKLEEYVQTLADKIQKDSAKRTVTGVYGPPRGGLVPAVMLSHKLNVPLLLAPCEGCIVVDDIADTGVTLQHFAEKGYLIAVILYKPCSKVVPNYYAVKSTRKTFGGAWIVFPWETTPN